MNQEPIRILHVIGIMNRGGAETMIMNLYRHMDRKQIQFDFVENSAEPAAFDEEILSLGGRIYRCPHYNGKNHLTYRRWWEQFFREYGTQYRAVHGHLGSTAAIYLGIARKYGVFTIAHSHNTTGRGLRNLIYQAFSYPTRYIADFFFGCSMDAGISRYGRRIAGNSSKFRVLNNAIETGRFCFAPAVRNEVRERYHMDRKTVIGHIGRFFPQKNHSFLIDIFYQIHSRNPDTVLLLVGDGELRGQVEAKVKALGLSDAVIFAGVQADVSKFYQAMDLFLLPSLYEGLGIVAVEAQCTGLRCVISDTVSKECIVTKDQVAVCGLSETAATWAETALQNTRYIRSDSSSQVKTHGYDISETSAWLSDFYLKKIGV